MLTLRSARELALMRKAGLVVWEAHQQAAGRVRPGVTTLEIDQAVEEVFQRHGAIPLFKGVPGKVPFPAATCVSVNDEVVHGIPGLRVLQSGDIVSVDTGCSLNGWCADSAVTHAVGDVSPAARLLLSVTQRTLELAIELLGRERLWSDVAREMAHYVRQHGFSVVEQFTGHGIGRSMHEEPQIPNFDSPKLRRDDVHLKPGLVLAIEPMVNMGKKEVRVQADHWTQSTCDGKPSAHFEHTVAVTSSGPWVLTGPPTADELG